MRPRWLRTEHECQKPRAGRRGVGSVWQCRCGREWRLSAKRQIGVLEYTTWSPAITAATEEPTT